MLVTRDDLEVRETAGSELAGPDFRFAGVASFSLRPLVAGGCRPQRPQAAG
jgi:hypothetical protein